MSFHGVNLSRRPFINARPVVRASVLLWLLGSALAAFNAWQYWGSFSGLEDKTARLEELNRRIEEERRSIGAKEGRLRQLRMENQNEQVGFLNEMIAARAFAWSALFDRLAEVLPRRVRILNLSPQLVEPRRKGETPSGGPRVFLQIPGMAEGDAALYEFVNRLFADPAFQEPRLASETGDGHLVRFQLSVYYLPEVVAGGALTVAADGAARGAGREETSAVASEDSLASEQDAVARTAQAVPGGAGGGTPAGRREVERSRGAPLPQQATEGVEESARVAGGDRIEAGGGSSSGPTLAGGGAGSAPAEGPGPALPRTGPATARDRYREPLPLGATASAARVPR